MAACTYPSPPVSGPPKQAEVVLVKTSPDRIVQGAWYRMPLLGLGYLAAYVRDRGVSVGIVDAMFDCLGLADTVGRIAAFRPRLVAFTSMTHEIARVDEVARALRGAMPEVRIAVGGPHPSALPRQTLEQFDSIDYAAAGEGEHTLHELIEALRRGDKDLGAIRGLVWRRVDTGEIVVNAPRPWIADLAALPRPAWDLYGPSRVYQIYGSRGCPYACIFCMRVLGDRVRFRPAVDVVGELEEIVERYGPEEIDFSDETFTMRRSWVEEICDEILRRGLHRRVRWFANGRVNNVDEEMLRRMRQAGCFRIGYGIESGNQEILERAQKGTTIEQIRRAIAATKRAGLESEAFYILGFPGETRRSALDTIRLAAELNTTTAAFGIMVPYPGTRVAEMASLGEGGYRLLSHDWRDFDKHLGNALELDTLSRGDLERLQARAYVWFYLRNLRLGDLARFFWEKRRAVAALAGKMLRRIGRRQGAKHRLSHRPAGVLAPRAYVMSQFPEFCETFILNELVELEKRGVPFQVFSLKRCRDAMLQPEARRVMERQTHYAPPLYSPAVAWAHATVAARHPLRYLATLGLALRALRGPWHVFAKTLYVFGQSAWFARQASKRALCHVHGHWASVPSSAALFIARLAGLPFSLTAHAYDIFIDRTLLAEKIHAARYLVTCTQYNRDFLLEAYPDTPPEKVLAAYHGTDLRVFDEAHDCAKEEPVILSVGRLCDTKGFPDLVEACRLLKERGLQFKCRIVGDGALRPEIEKRVRLAGLEGVVEITGLLPRERLIEQYRRARLFVLPCVVTPRGDRDGLPNVIVEAMAMGLCVVGTSVSALPEAIVSGETGELVAPHTPRALADAIEGLWDDAPRRKRLGENARHRVRERFGLVDNMDRLAQFIHRRDERDA